MAPPRVKRDLLANIERWLAEAVPVGEIAKRGAAQYGVSVSTTLTHVSFARFTGNGGGRLLPLDTLPVLLC